MYKFIQKVKCFMRCNLREEGHNLPDRVPSSTVEKSQWPECEAAGHTAPTGRKQRMDAGAQLTFSLFTEFRTPAYGMVLPTVRAGLPHLFKPF